jgi:hypothetical protein
VWKFFFTFADVLELPSFTLDEFVQSLHDYVSYGLVPSLTLSAETSYLLYDAGYICYLLEIIE